MSKFKSLRQFDHGEPSKVVNILDLEEPTPNVDEIVIKMEAAAIHLADIKRFRGEYRNSCGALARIINYGRV